MHARERVVEEIDRAVAGGAEPAVAEEGQAALRLGGFGIRQAASLCRGADSGEAILMTLVVLPDEGIVLGGAPVVADELIALPLVPDVVGLGRREFFGALPGARGDERI